MSVKIEKPWEQLALQRLARPRLEELDEARGARQGTQVTALAVVRHKVRIRQLYPVLARDVVPPDDTRAKDPLADRGVRRMEDDLFGALSDGIPSPELGQVFVAVVFAD